MCTANSLFVCVCMYVQFAKKVQTACKRAQSRDHFFQAHSQSHDITCEIAQDQRYVENKSSNKCLLCASHSVQDCREPRPSSSWKFNSNSLAFQVSEPRFQELPDIGPLQRQIGLLHIGIQVRIPKSRHNISISHGLIRLFFPPVLWRSDLDACHTLREMETPILQDNAKILKPNTRSRCPQSFSVFCFCFCFFFCCILSFPIHSLTSNFTKSTRDHRKHIKRNRIGWIGKYEGRPH